MSASSAVLSVPSAVPEALLITYPKVTLSNMHAALKGAKAQADLPASLKWRALIDAQAMITTNHEAREVD